MYRFWCKNLNNILLFISLLSILILPPISIEGLPRFYILDCLLIVFSLFILMRKNIIKLHYIHWISLFFISIIFLTIFINHLTSNIRSYFEIFKWLKFLILILFFSTISIDKAKKNIVIGIFFLLCIVNLMHYFDLFKINQFLEHYYSGTTHRNQFGLDSIGKPSVKRMLGTIGNPNDNALIFSFFSILFIPQKNRFINWFLFLIALLMVFMCQSRTGFIAIIITIMIYPFLNKKTTIKNKIKILLQLIIGFAFLFFIFLLDSDANQYISSLASNSLMKMGSINGRMAVWKELINMIVTKPLFGFGPNKGFFYKNKLYSENEYILILWRYGIIGLWVFIIFILSVFKVCISQLNTKRYLASSTILITIIILINSITNNPISNPVVFSLFGIILGFTLKKQTS